jgi:hypothetical protein
MHKRACESKQQARRRHLLSLMVQNALVEKRERIGLGRWAKGIGGRIIGSLFVFRTHINRPERLSGEPPLNVFKFCLMQSTSVYLVPQAAFTHTYIYIYIYIRDRRSILSKAKCTPLSSSQPLWPSSLQFHSDAHRKDYAFCTHGTSHCEHVLTGIKRHLRIESRCVEKRNAACILFLDLWLKSRVETSVCCKTWVVFWLTK